MLQRQNSRSLSKVELLPLFKKAHEHGYQPGIYRQLYLAHTNPVDDIALEKTRRLQRPPAQPTPVVRNTDKFDLRVIALPTTLDNLISDYQALHKRMPDEIRLLPDFIEKLKQAGLVRGYKYRGIVTLTPDPSLDKYSIHLDRFDTQIPKEPNNDTTWML